MGTAAVFLQRWCGCATGRTGQGTHLEIKVGAGEEVYIVKLREGPRGGGWQGGRVVVRWKASQLLCCPLCLHEQSMLSKIVNRLAQLDALVSGACIHGVGIRWG